MFKLRIFCAFLLLALASLWGQANGQQTIADDLAARQTVAIRSAGRFALVIGNSDYQHAPSLPNGKKDAAAIATALQNLGFGVSLSLNVNHEAMREAVEQFSRSLRPGDVSLFYYAGHGLQANGTNYLIPVDAALKRPSDLAIEGQRLDDVIDAMTVENNTAILLLDACRNNPFTQTLSLAKKSRAINFGLGLAPVDAGRGVYIGFATQPGNVALDGDGDHSPFAAALLRHIATSQIDIEILMRRVRADVMEATEQQQVPWSNSSLIEPGFAFRPDPEQEKSTIQNSKPPIESNAADLEFWRSIKDTSEIKMFRAYLAAFPAGTFSEIAKDRISNLKKPKAPKTKAPQTSTKKTKPVVAPALAPKRSSVSKPPTTTTIFEGRCRDGNIERCRQNCSEGRKRACRMLRKLGG
ncbi:caspase domain-containing protein [Mesorhizobium sp. M0152]|uniref:caspase family protein n=1 Tax=Mesorhizobium sp. M0152 TaxID=2956898 RepID=UPI00333508BD